MPDFVRVTNNDTKPFQYHWNNEKKRIPPGQDMMMPWNLACSLFGDPFLEDAPKKPDRTDALRRARGNFNYELGMESMDHFMQRVPKVQIFDMETGQEIHMLLFDPEGEHRASYVPPDAQAASTVELLAQQLANVQAQLAALLSAQGAGAQIPQIMGQANVVSTDAPGQTDAKVTEWVNGDPFAQRPEDQGAPLFDFSAISSAPIEDTPGPVDLDTDPGAPVADGVPVDLANAIPEDRPQDAGVGSGRGKARLAPK